MIEPNWLMIMEVNIVGNGSDTLVIVHGVDLGEGLGREHPPVAGLGQEIEHEHEFLHAVEAGRHVGQFAKMRQDGADGLITKTDASASILQEMNDARHMRIGENRSDEKIGRKLDSNLAGVALLEVLTLLPTMLEAGADQYQFSIPAHILYRIAYDAADAPVVLYEIEFDLGMAMEGVVEAGLASTLYMQKFITTQERDFRKGRNGFLLHGTVE